MDVVMNNSLQVQLHHFLSGSARGKAGATHELGGETLAALVVTLVFVIWIMYIEVKR
jgi:hypothetical protein